MHTFVDDFGGFGASYLSDKVLTSEASWAYIMEYALQFGFAAVEQYIIKHYLYDDTPREGESIFSIEYITRLGKKAVNTSVLGLLWIFKSPRLLLAITMVLEQLREQLCVNLQLLIMGKVQTKGWGQTFADMWENVVSAVTIPLMSFLSNISDTLESGASLMFEKIAEMGAIAPIVTAGATFLGGLKGALAVMGTMCLRFFCRSIGKCIQVNLLHTIRKDGFYRFLQLFNVVDCLYGQRSIWVPPSEWLEGRVADYKKEEEDDNLETEEGRFKAWLKSLTQD